MANSKPDHRKPDIDRAERSLVRQFRAVAGILSIGRIRLEDGHYEISVGIDADSETATALESKIPKTFMGFPITIEKQSLGHIEVAPVTRFSRARHAAP